MNEMKNRYSDGEALSEYHEALVMSLQFDLAQRTALSKLIMDARVELTGLLLELSIHESKKGKNNKTAQRREVYETIQKALDESARLDNDNYTMTCLVNQMKGEIQKWKAKFMEAEKQLEAVRNAWEAA